MSEHTETREKIKVSTTIKPPKRHKVIYLNDDHTPVDFVIMTLVRYFSYTDTSAREITYKIHEDGAGVVAVLPYEIAEQKGSEVMLFARDNGYPFNVSLEEE